MVTYFIPSDFIEKFGDHLVAVRSDSAMELVRSLEGPYSKKIKAVQLLALAEDSSPFSSLNDRTPLDLVMANSLDEHTLLENHIPLCAERNVRVHMPMDPGFMKAFRVAAELGFPVKLYVQSPLEDIEDEVLDALNYYLHSSMIRSPVEFFHSIFAGYLHNYTVNLWRVFEEDPADYRYVTRDGIVCISPKKREARFDDDSDDFLEKRKYQLLFELAECSKCPFFPSCVGYFKYPDQRVNCDSMKKVFRILKKASEELKADLDNAIAAEGERHD